MKQFFHLRVNNMLIIKIIPITLRLPLTQSAHVLHLSEVTFMDTDTFRANNILIMNKIISCKIDYWINLLNILQYFSVLKYILFVTLWNGIGLNKSHLVVVFFILQQHQAWKNWYQNCKIMWVKLNYFLWSLNHDLKWK